MSVYTIAVTAIIIVSFVSFAHESEIALFALVERFQHTRLLYCAPGDEHMKINVSGRLRVIINLISVILTVYFVLTRQLMILLFFGFLPK